MSPASGLTVGEDGRARCAWAGRAPDYVAYHDAEWGRPVAGDDAVFERLALEGFQSGLSWLTVLRKREAFREVFVGFSVAAVAAMDERDVTRLLSDARIIRHRGKVEATLGNARAALALPGGLAALVEAHRPSPRPRPADLASVPASTPASTALSRDLRSRGFRFVGPTTAYATMQALGLVDDHVEGCHVPTPRRAPVGRRTDD